MSGRTYFCEECEGTFETGWTDEEANEEAERLWGVTNASENNGMAQICEDCFQKLMRKLK